MKFNIVGTNLASLVCAHDLARLGHEIVHVIPHGYTTGGHFAGVKCESQTLDLGMILFEPRYSETNRSPSQYVNEAGADSNIYNCAVFDWIASTGTKLREVPVLSFYKGQISKDFLISDSLKIISQFDMDQILKMSDELTDVACNELVHPRMKNQSNEFLKSIEEIFPLVYGPSFSDFLFAIAQKIAGKEALGLVSKYHRQLWLPFYYSENILGYLRNGESMLDELSFYGASEGGVSGFVLRIKNNLKSTGAYQEYEITKQQYDSIMLNKSTFSNEVDAKELIFFDSSLFSDGEIETFRSPIAFIIYESTTSTEQRVVHSLDSESGWFRVSESLNNVGPVVVELGVVNENEDDSNLLERASRALSELSIKVFSPPKVLRSTIAFPISKKSTLSKNHHGNDTLVRPHLNQYETFANTRSINNQIILGLKSVADMEKGL